MQQLCTGDPQVLLRCYFCGNKVTPIYSPHNYLKMKHLPLLASILFLAACSPKYYAPNPQQIPAFHQKGEMAFSAAVGSDNRTDIQAAYAVGENIAVQVQGAFFTKEEEEETGDYGNGYLAEAGVGYYLPFAADKLVFESYLQTGFGHVSNNFPSTLAAHPNTTGIIDANLSRVGIQPSLTFTHKIVDVALSSRVSLLHYSNIRGDLNFFDEPQADYLENEKNHVLFEPAFTLRLGYDKFKVQLQLGLSVNMSNSSFRQSDAWSSIGAGYKF